MGHRRRRHAGAGHDQPVAARVDGLRHGAAALDVPGAAGGVRHRQPDRLLGVFRTVVHGGRDADPPRLRGPSAAVARVVAPIAVRRRRRSAWASVQILGRTAGAYPARPRVPRVRRDAVLRRHQVPRLVVALRGSAATGRPRHLRALALCDRQLLPGRLLGGSAVSRGAARRGGPHRRPLRPATALPGCRVRRAGDGIRRRACAVSCPAVVRTAGGADPPLDRLRPALPSLRPAAGHHPALRVRRRAVRHSHPPRGRAWYLGTEGHDCAVRARPVVDRARPARAGRTLGGALAGRSQRCLGAAGHHRTRHRRLRSAAGGHRTTHPDGMAGDRGGRARGHRRGKLEIGDGAIVGHASGRRDGGAARRRRARRHPRSQMARDAAAARRQRRAARVRRRDRRRTAAARTGRHLPARARLVGPHRDVPGRRRRSGRGMGRAGRRRRPRAARPPRRAGRSRWRVARGAGRAGGGREGRLRTARPRRRARTRSGKCRRVPPS